MEPQTVWGACVAILQVRAADRNAVKYSASA